MDLDANYMRVMRGAEGKTPEDKKTPPKDTLLPNPEQYNDAHP
jgi:hypothetical protein